MSDITQQCAAKFGEPIAGYAQILSGATEQPMSVWFVVGDQLVRIQHAQTDAMTWPINSLHGSMSHAGTGKTLTLSQSDGEMAPAIIALDADNASHLERFSRFLIDRGLDVT